MTYIWLSLLVNKLSLVTCCENRCRLIKSGFSRSYHINYRSVTSHISINTYNISLTTQWFSYNFLIYRVSLNYCSEIIFICRLSAKFDVFQKQIALVSIKISYHDIAYIMRCEHIIINTSRIKHARVLCFLQVPGASAFYIYKLRVLNVQCNRTASLSSP